ncbi:MAG: ABC transporter ATP-binding protein [Syntrophomonadaceae bacterium]|jgi:Fe-S cluster assembly ATP-binding protein|nr:ABC transporter ATP-binding protein [Syntrophomonadaceae bacterium]MDH7497907.1 ABC transporter ATP-binding protein [Syntrophomonadaceae bacterium]
MLKVENLHVEVGGRQVLAGVDLHIRPGETHVLFGPNGSGKSTLVGAIMGFARFRVAAGRILFRGQDITALPVHERARLGIGMAFQRPPVLRGVPLNDMLRLARSTVSAEAAQEMAEMLNLGDFLQREVNQGFSGGEIKRSEMLQLLAQDPDLVLLDEPESGVDLENIALIGRAINRLLRRAEYVEPGRSRRDTMQQRDKAGLIITHTGHILDYVAADVGHVLYGGRLSCTGMNPRELLGCIQARGYAECARCLE